MKRTLALLLSLVLLACAAPLALAEELPTLKMLGVFNPHDPNNDPSADAIEEMTGYHVEYYMLPSENALDNLLLQIASGESYDIMRVTEQMYLELLNRGALLPLNELLAEHGDNLTSLITEDAYSLTTSDDEVYGIPTMAALASIDTGLVIRGDILAELGLEAPSTAAEFKTVLEAVKAAYPDMIPFMTNGEERIGVITSGFGFYFDWNDVDGVLTHYVQMPEYSAYLEYMTDLYKAGLIDQDIAVNNATIRTEKFASGNVFAYSCGGWTDAALTAFIDTNGDKLIYLDPFKDADGRAGIKTAYTLNNVSCIPVTAANPEHAVKLMNHKLDHDVFPYLTLGTQDVTYTIDENGDYWPIMPIFTELRNNAWWYLNGCDMDRYGGMWMARTRRTKAVADIYDGLNKNADLYAINNPVDLCPMLNAVTENSASLSAMVKDYVLQVIVGVKNMDDHADFVAEWLKSGGQACQDAYNEWYMDR